MRHLVYEVLKFKIRRENLIGVSYRNVENAPRQVRIVCKGCRA